MFKIGDKVACPDKGIDYAEVVDVIHSMASEKTFYLLNANGKVVDRRVKFTDENLVAVKDESVSYDFHIETADTVVIVSMFECCEGKPDKFICRGHGHIIHDGALGIAQAASWALRKIYQKIEDRENGGKING